MAPIGMKLYRTRHPSGPLRIGLNRTETRQALVWWDLVLCMSPIMLAVTWRKGLWPRVSCFRTLRCPLCRGIYLMGRGKRLCNVCAMMREYDPAWKIGAVKG